MKFSSSEYQWLIKRAKLHTKQHISQWGITPDKKMKCALTELDKPAQKVRIQSYFIYSSYRATMHI